MAWLTGAGCQYPRPSRMDFAVFGMRRFSSSSYSSYSGHSCFFPLACFTCPFIFFMVTRSRMFIALAGVSHPRGPSRMTSHS